jgi:hypothetical protein
MNMSFFFCEFQNYTILDDDDDDDDDDDEVSNMKSHLIMTSWS